MIIKTILINNISSQLVTIIYKNSSINFGLINKNDSGILQINSGTNVHIELSRIDIAQIRELRKLELIRYDILDTSIEPVNNPINYFDYLFDSWVPPGDYVYFYPYG